MSVMKKKCIEKKAYGLKSQALAVARKMYLQDRTETAIYECDICLDFHLTSKWCNTQNYHKQWLTEKPKKYKKKKKTTPDKVYVTRNAQIEMERKRLRLIRGEIQKMYNEFLKLEREECAKRGLPCPYNYKITGTKKENTLPLSKQKEIFKLLTSKL